MYHVPYRHDPLAIPASLTTARGVRSSHKRLTRKARCTYDVSPSRALIGRLLIRCCYRLLYMRQNTNIACTTDYHSPITSFAGCDSPANIRRRSHSSPRITKTGMYSKRNDRPQRYAGPDAPGYRQELVESKQRGVCIAKSHRERFVYGVELSGQLSFTIVVSHKVA